MATFCCQKVEEGFLQEKPAGLLTILIITINHGIPGTAIAFPVGMALYTWLNTYIRRWEYREDLKRYAVMIENIYETSRYPSDRHVRKRAEYHRRMLKESKNPEPLKVHEFYFRHGEHCNESWEAFEARVEAFRLEDRRKHHKRISSESPDWYITNAMDQE